MNIREEYMTKTRDYLNDLYLRREKINILKNEIELLKAQDGNYNNVNYDCVGFNAPRSYRGIEDLVINNESKIYIKEAEIDFIESKNKTLNIYLAGLNSLEREVVEHRYFKRKDDSNQYSYKNISNKLRYSESTIKRRDNSAIKKLAYFKFGEDATY